jgi:2C-methyl-D-erythritol 2,4-cyclodiphosphate synthase
MRRALSDVLKLETDLISLKAKTAEKLGAIGQGDAVAAYAVSLILAIQ